MKKYKRIRVRKRHGFVETIATMRPPFNAVSASRLLCLLLLVDRQLKRTTAATAGSAERSTEHGRRFRAYFSRFIEINPRRAGPTSNMQNAPRALKVTTTTSCATPW
jgi:hypothetical protein